MSEKLIPVTCPCGATIHVGADAVEHIAEMGRTIKDWERINARKLARIVELQNRIQELELGLRPEDVYPPPGFVDDTWKNLQMRLFQ